MAHASYFSSFVFFVHRDVCNFEFTLYSINFYIHGNKRIKFNIRINWFNEILSIFERL